MLTEHSRQELEELEVVAKKKAWGLYLLTLTIPHTPKDSMDFLWSAVLGTKLQKSRKRYLGALQRFFNGKFFRAWSKKTGIIHRVRALEITDGEVGSFWTGYHFHIHIILIIEPRQDSIPPRAEDILSYWQNCCLVSGLQKPNIHGVDIRGADHVSAYIAKGTWSLGSEMTKTFSKRGREGHYTPRDWLIDYTENYKSKVEALSQHAVRSGNKYVEFVKISKGRHQLSFTKGLRKAIGLAAEKSEQEILIDKQEECVVEGYIDRHELKILVKSHCRRLFEETVRFQGWDAGRELIAWLADNLRARRCSRNLRDIEDYFDSRIE